MKHNLETKTASEIKVGDIIASPEVNGKEITVVSVEAHQSPTYRWVIVTDTEGNHHTHFPQQWVTVIL